MHQGLSRRATRRTAATAAAVAVVTLAACTGGYSSPQPGTRTAGQTVSTPVPATTTARSSEPVSTAPSRPATTPRPTADPTADELITGLTTPWGLAFFADGSALVAERDTGAIKWIKDGRVQEVGIIPDVEPSSEGGLLGLAIAPNQEVVFAYYSAANENRIVAMTWDGSMLGEPNTLLDKIPEAGTHNGGQLVIGPDGLLYASTGDARDDQEAQNRKSLNGKILRLTLDGQPAPGNPFDNEVYSYGHRNVQGLAFDDQDRLWASEFGSNTWDELNLITAGGNYGWPAAEGSSDLADMINPQVVWRTDEASPSALAYWQGSLWMAGLRGERLWEIPVEGGQAGEPEAHFAGDYGRLRAVKVVPDGSALWLGTSNTDGRGDPRDGDDRLMLVTR